MVARLSVDEAVRIVEDFRTEFPALRVIRCDISDNEEKAYGHEHAKKNKETGSRTCGAYYPKFAAIRISASSNHSKEDLRRTLRHELLGHFGLNTFWPDQKRCILDAILRYKGAGKAPENWDYLDKMYPGASKYTLAEEFFAHLCEHSSRPSIKISDSAFKKITSTKSHIPSGTELMGLANYVAERAANNDLIQKTFPATNSSSFKALHDIGDFKFNPLLTAGFNSCLSKNKLDKIFSPEP